MKLAHGTLLADTDPTPWVMIEPEEIKSKYTMIWLQGWTSTIEGHAEAANRIAQTLGIRIAILDYAGHGTHPVSLDKSTKSQQLTEVIALYDELTSRGFVNIIANGGSFGGYMAALLSQQRGLRALILRAAAVYDEKDFEKEYGLIDINGQRGFRKSIDPESQNHALHAVSSFNGPVFILHHENDDTIPVNVSRAFFMLAKQPSYFTVPRTSHSPKYGQHPTERFHYVEKVISDGVELIHLEDLIK